jgi:hypothetical protein
MKRIVCILFLFLTGLALQAQSYKLVLPEGIPADAAKVLEQRFTQMLQGSGITLADDGAPLTVTAQVVSRVETPGSMSQTALTIDLVAKAGDVVATFPVKGVGEGDADAWLRAVKQLLPKSKSALEFVEKLK